MYTMRLQRILKQVWGPLLKGPEKFSHPERHLSKISNLMITELCYSHILNINRGFIHTSFRNGFSGQKRFRAFRPRPITKALQYFTLNDKIIQEIC